MGNLPTLHFGYSDSNERTRLWFDNGDSEELLLIPLDNNLYRLDESSFLGEAMYGDVIRASRHESDGLHFLGVEKRSKLVSQSWCLSQAIVESAECASVLSEIVAMGGMWERAFGGILLIHTPQGLEGEIADRIKRLMTPPRDSTKERLSDKR